MVADLTHGDLFNLLDWWVSWDRRGGGSDIDHGLSNWTLVARAAEPRNCFLITARNGWRTRLLEADNISSEAEAEVARVVTRDLLCRKVNLTIEDTSTRTDYELRGCSWFPCGCFRLGITWG